MMVIRGKNKCQERDEVLLESESCVSVCSLTQRSITLQVVNTRCGLTFDDIMVLCEHDW